MSYQALYRVYRPQTFSEVVGQEHITKTLQNALLEGSFTHAYLFSGPRGTGKTSTAKILAKAVNCEQAPVAEPCNQCSACLGITQGRVVDVLEIDAASNNGVEQIREIREHVKFAPTEVRRKVYIIDEVHMLSQGAFNALLKTLEEPPEHVLFILATTEPHKIPLTIISRCQRFDFRRISKRALLERLTYITEEQGIAIQKEALELIAQVAEGGLRDALSVLDQVVAYAGDEVTLEDCLAVTGSVAQEALGELADAILRGQVDEAIRQLDLLMDEGKDPLRLVEDLLYYFRDILLYQTAPTLEELFERAQLSEQFKERAPRYPRKNLFAVIERLSTAQQEMKWSTHPRVFLEVALIQLVHQLAEDIQGDKEMKQAKEFPEQLAGSLSKLAQKVEQLEKELEQLKQEKERLLQGRFVTGEIEKSKEKSPAPKASPERVKQMLKTATKAQLISLTGKWPMILDDVKKRNIRVHAWLKDGQPVACSKDYFLLAFQNEIHRETTEKESHRAIIEEVVQKHLQSSAKMMTIMYNEWDEIKEAFIREQKGEDTAKQEEARDPFVEEAYKLVGPDLVEVMDSEEES